METVIDTFFFLVGIALAVSAYFKWKNSSHRDYWWLFILWGILVVTDLVEYAYDYLATIFTALRDSPSVFTPYWIINSTITFTVIFLIFAIYTRWIVYSPRNVHIFRWVHSKPGIAVITFAMFLVTVALHVSLSLRV